jgi:hypothetical protein
MLICMHQSPLTSMLWRHAPLEPQSLDEAVVKGRCGKSGQWQRIVTNLTTADRKESLEAPGQTRCKSKSGSTLHLPVRARVEDRLGKRCVCQLVCECAERVFCPSFDILVSRWLVSPTPPPCRSSLWARHEFRKFLQLGIPNSSSQQD